MSIYTMSLAEAIEFHGRENLGLDSYPVISEAYRTRINDLIIDQYINREIGQETFSLFRHAMRRKMAQDMPVYNKLYLTETAIVDPLHTIDIQTLSTTNRDSTTEQNTKMESEQDSHSTTGTGSKSRNVSSETPQVFLSDNGNYATAAADARSDATGEATGRDEATSSTDVSGRVNDVDVMDSRTTGFQGSQAQLILDFRNTIINIDMMIVNGLESLFMGIWNTGNSYTPNTRGYYF